MKNMWESSETFTAYATIEAGYYMLMEISKQQEVRTGIVKAIDQATGYDIKLEKDLAAKVIPIIKDVIKAKKVIESDYSKDLELLSRSMIVVNSEQNPERSKVDSTNSPDDKLNT